MDAFTPWTSLGGGVLIGLAAVAVLLLNGRIAGISGIVGGLLPPLGGAVRFRVAFVGGLIAGGGLAYLWAPELFESTLAIPLGLVALAGGLVGFGTRVGSGCTSGHGVCGIGRFSKRSIVATVTFIATGGVAVFVVHHLWLGGVS